MSKQADFLVKLRDAAQMMSEACNEYLESLVPAEAKEQKAWDPGKIKWSQDTGQKGAYERYPGKDLKAESTEDYRCMLEDLKTHKGVLNRDGFFYWVFTDQATVGRRKK